MPARLVTLFAVAFATITGLALAQTPDTFTARLSWVPISLAEQNVVAGYGTATATLSRARLSVAGSFEGLPAPATRAVLHRGVATGASGPAIAELDVTQAADGTISGEAELDREQRAALLAGHVYIRLHAEIGVPPDNAVLRGWLLAETDAAPRR